LISNIISSIDGRTNEFYQAELETYFRVFPQVEIFPVHFSNSTKSVQNLAFVAFKKKREKLDLKSKDPQIQNLLDNYYNLNRKKSKKNNFFLKDDFAPTQKYASNLITWKKQ